MSSEVFDFKFAFAYNTNFPEELDGYLDRSLYIQAGEVISRKYFALYKFYDDNNLSLVKLTADGKIIHDPVYKEDLTEEGYSFSEAAGQWLDLKSSEGNPPDILYLKKKLERMRGS